jgi:hypothetical protein
VHEKRLAVFNRIDPDQPFAKGSSLVAKQALE